jgi:hypothetical protein
MKLVQRRSRPSGGGNLRFTDSNRKVAEGKRVDKRVGAGIWFPPQPAGNRHVDQTHLGGRDSFSSPAHDENGTCGEQNHQND